MTHVEGGVSLGDDNTFNIYSPDLNVCSTCPLNKLNQPQITPKRGYGMTKSGGGKKKLSHKEQLVAKYGPGIRGAVNKPATSCEVYGGMSVMSTSEASTVEQISEFAPCLGGNAEHNGNGHIQNVGSGSLQDRLRSVYGRNGNGEP